MNDSLPPKVQRAIARRLRSGKYQTAGDVLMAAMERLEQHERIAELSAAELAAIFPGIRGKVSRGLKQAEAGKTSDGEAFFGEQIRKLKRRVGRRKIA